MSNLLADVGLVHGAGFETIQSIEGIKTVPSVHTKNNAVRAGQLMNDGRVEAIVVSGCGPIINGKYLDSEASLMKQILMGEEFGISEELIEVDDGSSNTVGNWVNGGKIAAALPGVDILGVTRPSHLRRAQSIGRFIAPRLGLHLVGYELSEEEVRVTSTLREGYQTRMFERFMLENQDLHVDDFSRKYDEKIRRSPYNLMKRLRYGSGPKVTKTE